MEESAFNYLYCDICNAQTPLKWNLVEVHEVDEEGNNTYFTYHMCKDCENKHARKA